MTIRSARVMRNHWSWANRKIISGRGFFFFGVWFGLDRDVVVEGSPSVDPTASWLSLLSIILGGCFSGSCGMLLSLMWSWSWSETSRLGWQNRLLDRELAK